MANKQVVVRTAQDLERKYNLAALLGMGKNIEINKAAMQKLENELNQFVVSTIGDIENLKAQVDGKVTTWYYTGTPTLTNKPAIDWTTDDIKNEHVGDLYYDKATGYTYVFQYENEYSWLEIKDQDIAGSLAIANAAKDTADSKRQVFVKEPTTPYDTGDLWINNNEIFICQVTRKEGNFNPNDWINNLKYTDDTVAIALSEELSGFIATTTEHIEDLQKQIDGTITTWYYEGEPTLNNKPANDWDTDTLKNTHIGDLYYDKTTGYCYRFVYEESKYKWVKIADSDVVESLRIANEAKDTADSKRRVFATTPFVPYDVGDLWLKDKELYVCKAGKTASQSFSDSDFEKAVKYTDDSALNTFIEGEYSDEIDAISEQIDKKAETWYQATEPSDNWQTTEVKTSHIGDLWYNTNNKKSYIYTSSFTWAEANGVPDSVYDAIDGKAQIFTKTPTTPYHVGDLYTEGSSGDIYVCKTERLTGSYTASDWQKASKYTDDTNLNTFVNVTYTNQVNELNNKIDTKITTWYYSGVPTLSNSPANEWTNNDLKAAHVGDLYYDKSTGYTYRFNYENSTYSWKHIVDSDLTQALAKANEASDTADSKRRIFTSQPTTPYDAGDLWINNQEIYVCKTSKQTGNFASSDFIKATKYTDDTTANAVQEELMVLSGTVTTITENYVKYTDLSTGGSTIIAGENITTGNIESENYVENTSGTKISLEDGTIDTKNFKVDEEGNVTMESASISNGKIESPNLNIDVLGDLVAYDAVFNNINIRGGNITLEDDGTAENSSIKIKAIQEVGEVLTTGTNLSSQKLLFTIDENTVFPQPTDLSGATIPDGYRGEVNLVETSGGYKVRLLAIAQRVNAGSMINYTIDILKDNTKIESIYSRRVGNGAIVRNSLYVKEYEMPSDAGSITNLYNSTVTTNILLSQSITRTTNYYGYGIETDIVADSEFTATDVTKVNDYVYNSGTLTDIELAKYDVDKDGQVTPDDYKKIKNYVSYNITDKNSGKFIIDTKNVDKNIRIIDGDGNERVSLGIEGLKVYGGSLITGRTEVVNMTGLPSGGSWECVYFKDLEMVWFAMYVTGSAYATGTRHIVATIPEGYRPARRTALAIDGLQDLSGVLKASISTAGEIGFTTSVAKESGDDMYISGWWRVANILSV